MPVRIRLQRHGKKGKPFYWIVAADSRSKRDGRYLEKLGTYNPNTNPATVNVDVDGAIKWLENGAQPSDTARTLLSYRGVMLKHHLNGGVKKGAFTQEDADKKFSAWLEEKSSKIQSKIDGLDKDKAESLAKRLELEKAINQKRIEDLAAKPVIEEVNQNDNSSEEQASEVINVEEAPAVPESLSEESKSENSDEVVNEVEPNEAASETSENVSSEEPATSDIVEESADIKETVIKEDNKDNKENVVEAESAKEEVVSETSEDVPVEDSVSGEKEEASPSEDASEEEETK
ncbi:MAG: 30S ribosomal protein S16 [Bacteroidota bacterium]|nr:30S ribosomal protein S16 [Bacteroidota bacterium]